MQTVHVAVQRDHLERLARTRPLLGVVELIWNALDAEASEVRVSLSRNPLGGISDVIVRDNGHGFTHQQALEEFGRLGGSWKSQARTTKGGLRKLHGSRGEGRFRAFAIGPSIKWETVAQSEGGRFRTRVDGELDTLGEFTVHDPAPSTAEPNTEVFVTTAQERLQSLDADDASIQLLAYLAVYLSNYPDVRIYYDGVLLDPESVQTRIARYSLGLEPAAELLVIEWEPSVDRALYLCDADGFTLQELNAGIHAPGFNFTAHVLSARIGDIGATDIAVGEMHPEVQPIVEAARQRLREHFRERRNENRTSIVDRWKASNTYPYDGDPVSPIDEARREVFDLVAVEVADRLPDFGGNTPATTRLSLRLLSEAIEQSPGALRRILEEVLNLEAAEREDFANLLEQTTLAAMIKASRVVADRIDFCMALEALVFSPETKKQLLERSQLHRILADETWIWGEEFNLTVDDESLDAVLRHHLGVLNREELAPVAVPEQSSGIVDLMLSRVRHDIRGEREHLVVELKRPSVRIGSEEITQIKKYAYAVAEDGRFHNTETRWNMWLVSNEMNEFAEKEASQDHRDFGLIVDLPRLQVWVHTWGQVIEAARRRLRFFQEQLGYAPSAEKAREYLHLKHAEYLPSTARD